MWRSPCGNEIGYDRKGQEFKDKVIDVFPEWNRKRNLKLDAQHLKQSDNAHRRRAYR